MSIGVSKGEKAPQLIRLGGRVYPGCGDSPGVIVRLREEVLRSITDVRVAGGRIVFTNGCFDLLHPGHVAYLSAARKLGDMLVIGLNSDTSVARLKGPSRPIVPEQDRAAVLEALEAVDAVLIFDEDTPVNLMREVRPHVYVKGGDYKAEDLPEAGVARELNAETVILPYEEGYSTTNLIQRIQDLPRREKSV